MPSPRRWPILLVFALASAGRHDRRHACSAQALAADTPQTTAMGATFIAPPGWSIVVRGPATILEAPEHDSHIALVDIRKAADADAAVAAAWAAYRAGCEVAAQGRHAASPTRTAGQNQRSYYLRDVAERAARGLGAGMRSTARVWTVVIVDMSQPTAEKRLAQVALVFSRLLPKGYQRETFAGKKANPLDAARIADLSAFVERARESARCSRRRHRTGPERQGRLRRRLRRPRARQAGEGRRRHALHDRVEHEGDDDAAARQARRRGKLGMGHAGHEPPAVVQARRRATTTRQVLVRHLICACTGLPRQDFEWLLEFKNATPESALAVLGTMQPTSKFGEMFQYSNALAAAAGYVAGHVAFPELELGAAYDRAMRTRVFGPLGMTATTFDFARALAGQSRRRRTRPTSTASPPPRSWTSTTRSCRCGRPAAHGATSATCCGTSRWSSRAALLPDGTRYIDEAPLLDADERRRSRSARTRRMEWG